MAGSDYLYRFLSSVWDNLPKKERSRFSELWKGQEQVFADVYQRFIELDQSLNINTIPVYLSTRWNKYLFNDDNKLTLPATFTSYQDLSLGLDLTDTYWIAFSIDDGPKIEIDCRGKDPQSTQISEIVYKINEASGFVFASSIFENTIIKLQTATKGPDAKITILSASETSKDATEIIFGLTSDEVPLVTPRLPFKYALSDKTIRKMPSMQDSIRNESLKYLIVEDLDFYVNWKEGYMEFKEEPLEVLWAKITYIDEEMPFYNYGYLIDYRDSSISAEDYLQNLQGLWFAFWQGPRPEFIKRALALLFSLPVAVDDGLILSKKDGIMEILHLDGQVRSYYLPSQLNWVLKVDDYVEKFEVLTDGIDIYDKTNLPGFVRTEIGREAIAPYALPEATLGEGPDTDESKAIQALEEHTFLPQINVNAFVRPNINVGSIFRFLDNIKPLQKSFYFQVIVAIFGEELALSDKIGFNINIDVTPNLDINQANWAPEADREAYEELDNAALNLDSDTLGFFDRGSLTFSNNAGSLPQYDVVFD